MEPARVKQKTENLTKGKGPASSAVPGRRPKRLRGTECRDRAHRGPAPPRTLSPKSRFASQQRASESSWWTFLSHSTAQGTGLGRDSGCTCWIRNSPQSPGKLARAGSQPQSGPGQLLGWGPGAKRGWNKVEVVVQGAKAGTWGKS